MTIPGKIHCHNERTGCLTIFAPFDRPYDLDRKDIRTVEIRLHDGRSISPEQRRKIYATLRDISEYTGHPAEQLKDYFKADMLADTGGDWFSLSDTDMTTANQYLEHLIRFCVEWEIPTRDSLIDTSPDISRYIYHCLAHKRCAICGKKAELHHVDHVGAGRSRREITHSGMRAQPLCGGVRGHHQEVHIIGQESFDRKYHTVGVKLDNHLCAIWRVRGTQHC